MLPRSSRSLVLLFLAFVLLCGDQPDMPVGPPSCCGNCPYLSLYTESLYPLEMLMGVLVFASAVIACAEACTCGFLGLLLREHPDVPFQFYSLH